MRITVKFVNQPTKPDAKYGNIKTTDDQTIMVPIGNLNHFQRGMTCDLATEVKTWGSGAEARPVTIAVGLPGSNQAAGYGGNQMAAATQQGYAQQASAPAQGGYTHAAPYAPPTGPGPQASLGGPPRGNPEARAIFATGVVGRAMGSGKFAASEISTLLEEALRVYDKNLRDT